MYNLTAIGHSDLFCVKILNHVTGHRKLYQIYQSKD
jgi:hypothetical protein